MAKKPSKRRPHHDLLVLIVDSDDARAERDAEILRAAAFVVQVVPSGLHAQRVLEAKDNVALVLAEHDLVGIDGLSLLTLVRRRWPKVRLVLSMSRPSGELVMRAYEEALAKAILSPRPKKKLLDVVKMELHAYARRP